MPNRVMCVVEESFVGVYVGAECVSNWEERAPEARIEGASVRRGPCLLYGARIVEVLVPCRWRSPGIETGSLDKFDVPGLHGDVKKERPPIQLSPE